EEHCIGDYASHWFTALPLETGDPLDDLVWDATYKQFIRQRMHRRLPDIFAGRRGDMVDLIGECGLQLEFNQNQRLYLPETLVVPDRLELSVA
ncbi:MAG: hypothetical protein ABWY71_00820, partial [Candidatus Saccharimonadales bacterium]